jgi:CBS domain-containing protein
MKSMNVEQVMSSSVRTCRGSDSVSRAAQIMWEDDIGCVVVVDDEGEAIAMVTDRDICMAAFTQGRRLEDIPVSVAMSHRLIALSARDTIETAERLMADYRVRRLPVLDEHSCPIGLVSLNDLARHASAGHPREDHYVTRTLAAVSAPSLPLHGR